jgi:signal transduction histidine kinase
MRHIHILETALEKSSDMDKAVRKIGAATALRITVIDATGVVLAESDFDKDEMENHLMRPEVQQAVAKGQGRYIRHSDTVNHDFLNVVKKTTLNGRTLYLRIGESLEYLNTRFMTFWIRVASIFFIAIILAVGVSGVLSRKIKIEIDNIKAMLEAIASKEYAAIPPGNSFVSEFTQIKSLLRQIAKRLSRREKQKRKFEAKLRLKNRQQRDIISALSHEFKNPIAVILGYSETLKSDPAMPEPVRTKFLQKIDKNAQRISSMLDRLTLSTKIENHDLTVNPVYFNLQEVATDVKNMMEDKYAGRTITVTGPGRGVRADRTMIEMILINLCENALKYSQDDVRIIIDNDKVSVEDKGVGISDEELENITKKFYRVEENSWDNSLGLGLAIVTYMLKLHNSRLLITSKPGEGSTFSFFI